ncbi:MAG: choice-of-anchor J domain-containing protein [Planctomycetes bacterium]|nr:choice-of-anchor J domain-containing protein [Planctomycetota bacterium]
MKTLPWLLPLLLAGPLSAQQTFLTEDFSAGLVPPAGWTEGNNGNSFGWELDGDRYLAPGHAFHDDYTGPNDNFLMTPQMDLTTAAQAFAYCDQGVYYYSWRDHHYVDVSLDNGVTFINVADDLAGDGVSVLNTDISAYAGVNGVNVAWHYTGDFASEWGIDNVVVDDAGPPPPAILFTAVNPANGHTYHLLEQGDWVSSEAAAVILGGNLATIDDQPENDWVFNTFGNFNGLARDLWIGYTDEAVEGVFVWTSGATSAYTNWAAGQPDNNGGIENWVHMYGFGSIYGPGEWNDMFNAAAASWSPGFFGVVEIPTPAGPQITISNLVGGAVAVLDGGYFSANGAVRIGYSLAGGGPVGTPYGVLELSPPIREAPRLFADPSGNIIMSAPIPAALSGRPIWIQAFDVVGLALSNGLAEVVG